MSKVASDFPRDVYTKFVELGYKLFLFMLW